MAEVYRIGASALSDEGGRNRILPQRLPQDIRLGFQGFNRNCRETHGVTDG